MLPWHVGIYYYLDSNLHTTFSPVLPSVLATVALKVPIRGSFSNYLVRLWDINKT
jgi:hypothetical protein